MLRYGEQEQSPPGEAQFPPGTPRTPMDPPFPPGVTRTPGGPPHPPTPTARTGSATASSPTISIGFDPNRMLR